MFFFSWGGGGDGQGIGLLFFCKTLGFFGGFLEVCPVLVLGFCQKQQLFCGEARLCGCVCVFFSVSLFFSMLFDNFMVRSLGFSFFQRLVCCLFWKIFFACFTGQKHVLKAFLT